jgi:Protein of unknown function (DUF1573)
MKKAMLALFVVALGSAAAPAQSNWGDKLFKEGTTHDFGNVAHGAQLYKRFTITNIYAVPLDILDVKVSCGCTTATPSAKTLQPREVGYLDVNMDARKFTGPKTVRITIVVGPQYTSTAELKLTANSRQDIVFNPGDVNFGSVAAGDSPTLNVDVEYAGALDWRITGADANGGPFDVQVEEFHREVGKKGQPGAVGYHVKVTMKKEAPVGALRRELILKTNDPASEAVPVLVEANVQAPLTVSPEVLRVGDLKAGQEITKKVMVRGSKPFKIVAVEGGADLVSVASAVPSADGLVQQTLAFRCAGAKTGEFRRQFKIKTDLQEAPVTVTVEGNVVP